MSEIKKSKWDILLPGKASFAMVGSLKTQAEALEYARVIWPNCEVE